MKKCIGTALLAWAVFAPSLASAAITSVTLTPATPTTLSNGKSYYCAGVSSTGGRYTFRIQAVDMAATGQAYWNTIRVDFMQGAAVRESFTVNVATNTAGGSTGIAFANADIVDNNGGAGPWTRIDYNVTVSFRWDCAPYTAANNNIVATVTANGGATTNTDTRNLNYGVISRVAIYGFSQSIPAANSRVTPWNDAFNVTGRIVYYDTPAETITTQVPPLEIAGVNLYYTRGATVANTGFASGGALPNVSFPVPASYFVGLFGGVPGCIGSYAWDVRVAMNTAGSPETSANTLGIICDLIRIDTFAFEGGGGINQTVAGTYNVRSVNVSGTRIRIRASTSSGAAMAGTTTFAISDSLANTYTVTINNGSYEGSVTVAPMPAVAVAGNIAVNYTVTNITGSAYGGGQSAPALIPNSGPYICRWENNHPPGNQAPFFTTQPAPPGDDTATANSITLYWYPLDAGAASANHDLDFYSYRIYYRMNTEPASAARIIDGDSNPALKIRGTVGTPLSFTIGGTGNELVPLTQYDYTISAIDVFGHEVLPANRITNQVTTLPSTIEASISDGISLYTNAQFNADQNPASHVVRPATIKVTVKIVTSGSMPDRVDLVIANNDSDLAAQFGTGTADNLTSLPATGAARAQWSYSCRKIGANTYEGFIPSTCPLVRLNTSIRMGILTYRGGVASYNDIRNDQAAPYAHEWRFRIAKPVVFIPWPTRVLNNVLTGAIPCCFPAYFLTVDSLVTIKVYDAKGRVISILADRMYRPGGQNIRDTGWCGVNKDNRRVGPGLYYIHIKAVTLGNRTTLDKMLKVVVAH